MPVIWESYQLAAHKQDENLSLVHLFSKDTDNPPDINSSKHFICIFWKLIDSLWNECCQLTCCNVSQGLWNKHKCINLLVHI